MQRFLKATAQAAIVVLVFFGAAAAWGIRVHAVDVLAPNPHWHAVEPVSWASRLVEFRHEDGAVSHGVRIDRPGAVATVLYFGGNGFTLDRFGYRARTAFAHIPVNVVMYDRRGYGRTEGKPNITRWLRDAIQIYRHTVATESVPVIIHGHSMGTFIASKLVAEVNPRWVVLEAPGTTVSDFVRAHLPYGIGPFVRLSLDPDLAMVNTVAWLKEGSAQVAILKAPLDNVLPSWMADAVASGLPKARERLITCPGATHNDMGQLGCFGPAYAPWVAAFRQARSVAGGPSSGELRSSSLGSSGLRAAAR